MNIGERTRLRTSAVERIAGWSARHPKAAVVGWFGLVAAAFVTGQLLGTQSLPQYDPGQAGLGEQVLHRLHVTTPPQESVLIQPRGRPASRFTFASDPRMRQAARQVAVALSRLRSCAADIHQAGLVSADGHSALVTFQVPGSRLQVGGRVTADLAAVAKVQARYPDLLIAEAGSASANAAGNALLESDFRRAEYSAIRSRSSFSWSSSGRSSRPAFPSYSQGAL